MSFVSSVLSFMAHYASEAQAVSTALSNIVNALPIQQQDRDRINAEIAKVAAAPSAIIDWIEKNGATVTPMPVNIDAADIDKAVSAYLTTHLGDMNTLVNSVVETMKVQGLVVGSNNPNGAGA